MTGSRPSGRLLAVAAVAIGFAAVDTYVVVMALPAMMTASGLSVTQLQRAAPIVSGFLLGYVAVLPVIGRIADLRGRVPVLLGCLLIFLVGSLTTAAGYDLTSIVAGRVIQGLGAGGLVPPTLALVADIWPAELRGLPLGVISAIQEIGSVLGPLYGALILAVADWRVIFVVNAVAAALLAVSVLVLNGSLGRQGRRLRDLPGLGLLTAAGAAGLLLLSEPRAVASDITTGQLFVPLWGDSRWATPLGFAGLAAVGLFVVREFTAGEPLIDIRSWRALATEVDLAGAVLLTIALGAVILTFASAEPEKALLSPGAPWLVPLTAAALALFSWRQRRASHPLVPRGALALRPAWGAVLVSFFVGVALIAALVDIPLFARLAVYHDSQLNAALVLVRFLVALPVGAVLGGWLLRRLPAAAITSVAMLLSGLGFLVMAHWSQETLSRPITTLTLVLTGIGFGLALAPLNAALLTHTAPDVHGVSSALLVVARMTGMLVGISALTAIGLWAFTGAVGRIPAVQQLCHGPLTCSAYTDAVLQAGLDQLRSVFAGAAVSSVIAAILAALLLRHTPATGDR